MQDDENRDPALTAALRQLAEADSTLTASPRVEARLRREVQSLGRARRKRSFVFAFAAAAAVVLAAVFVWRASAPASGKPATIALAPGTASTPREVVTPFYPLIYGGLSQSGHIVRMSVPRQALASFGLGAGEIAGAQSATVLADVIVGDDGLARAVRFVQQVNQE